MFLPKLFASAAVVAAMIPVAAAHAAAPWSDPVAVPGSTGQAGAPQVLFTRTRGGAIAFNGAGSIPGAPVAAQRCWAPAGRSRPRPGPARPTSTPASAPGPRATGSCTSGRRAGA